MVPRCVEISTPSRLHCGMLAFGHDVSRQFGGLGIMIDRPRVRLRMRPSERLQIEGPLADRVAMFARSATRHEQQDPGVAIEILEAPPSHVGLGSGTQLALAVAAGIAALEGLPHDNVAELAQRVNRGKRSSVGMHGFAGGGMILEGGKRNPSGFGPLITRVTLPETWRFVLLLPHDAAGLSGADETKAIQGLPSVPEEATAEMCRLLLIELLPAAVEGDYEVFADRLEQFGKLAGECFASVQGGPYAAGRAAEAVQILQELGGRGIAQSSWGPGVFAVCANDAEAAELCERLHKLPDADSRELVIAKADNHGAVLKNAVDEV